MNIKVVHRRPEICGCDYGLIVVTVVGLLSACSRADSERALTQLPGGTPSAIAALPELRVGVLEGDSLQEFDRVTTPFLMPDGRLVVPLSGFGVLRIFDVDGSHLMTLGHDGEGPGEFQSLSSAWARGDTIEAFDDELGRITRFLPGGGVETVPLEMVRSAQAAVPAVFPDGWMLYGVASVGQDGRDQMPVHWFDRSGKLRGDVTHVKGMWRYVYEGGRGPTPLSPRAWFAGHGGHLYVADGLVARILVFDPAGILQRELSWTPVSPRSAQEALAVVVDSAVARMSNESRVAHRRQLEEGPPPQLPVFSGLIVDDAGFVWLRPYEPLRHSTPLGGLGTPGPGGSWRILSPQGVDVGAVEVPIDLEPIQITADRVVGISRDEFGVESVRVHRLTRHH